MATALLILVVVLVVAALVFGVVSLLSGDDPGLSAEEPDGRARPLPNTRSLTESDLKSVRFDVALRGYRMAQVDRVLRRTAYDVGYKDEMIAVLEAEVTALRDGRLEDAELLRKARESAASPATASACKGEPATDASAGGAVAGEAKDQSAAGQPVSAVAGDNDARRDDNAAGGNDTRRDGNAAADVTEQTPVVPGPQQRPSHA